MKETTKAKRKTKTPQEAAIANVNNAITQLEALGSRLFKLENGTAQIETVQTTITTLRTLRDAL
jgi:hypothetical protein